MPYIAKLQSLVNHTDACSTGNKEAGLVNTWESPSIPRNILKRKTKTNLEFSLTGKSNLQCCIQRGKTNGCSSYIRKHGKNLN
tara:strand:- start:29 stop:277 length:249 start_codon:yes stop_codon:yes gene_type:complete